MLLLSIQHPWLVRDLLAGQTISTVAQLLGGGKCSPVTLGVGVIGTYSWDRLNHFHPYCSPNCSLGFQVFQQLLRTQFGFLSIVSLGSPALRKILSHLSSSNPNRCLSLFYLLLISSETARLSPSQLSLPAGLSC